ncbi:MAG: hypothetical protein KF892_23670 [Rhizobacter sp.]|nr:hypothetical protein [Rhizobacter sp.]
MTHRREVLLYAAANEVGLPIEFAKLLAAECPWLDGHEEINEDFGPDLLVEQFTKQNVSRSQVKDFLYAYNARVRAHSES